MSGWSKYNFRSDCKIFGVQPLKLNKQEKSHSSSHAKYISVKRDQMNIHAEAAEGDSGAVAAFLAGFLVLAVFAVQNLRCLP